MEKYEQCRTLWFGGSVCYIFPHLLTVGMYTSKRTDIRESIGMSLYQNSFTDIGKHNVDNVKDMQCTYIVFVVKFRKGKIASSISILVF